MQAVMSIQKAATQAKDSELMQGLMPLKELVTGEDVSANVSNERACVHCTPLTTMPIRYTANEDEGAHP